jgi:hypothetical protein
MAVLVAGCAPDGPTASDEPTRYVTVVDGPWPRHDPPAAPDELVQEAAQLVDWHSDDLAGSYVDDDGTLVVLAATDRGEQLAGDLLDDRPGSRVDRVSISLDQANDLLDDWAHSSPSMAAWFRGGGYDPFEQAIAVVAVRRPPQQALSDLESRATAADTPVIVYVDPGAGGGSPD